MVTKEFKLTTHEVKLPVFKSGDTVRVWQKIVERVVEKDKVKEKTRSQAFEGLVLGRKHGTEPGATFTVRRMVDGIGVERIFPVYSPLIDKIEVLKTSDTRRSKLYHIRKKAAKEIRKQMKHVKLMKDEAESKIVMEAPVEAKKEPETQEKK